MVIIQKVESVCCAMPIAGGMGGSARVGGWCPCVLPRPLPLRARGRSRLLSRGACGVSACPTAEIARAPAKFVSQRERRLSKRVDNASPSRAARFRTLLDARARLQSCGD